MLRRKPLKRKASLKTRKPIPKQNKKRADANYARAYHSEARVKWVQQLLCMICRRSPCENAHTVTGGMGRKSGYANVIPLCPPCHRAIHAGELRLSADLKRAAASYVNTLWLDYSKGKNT